MPPLSQFPNALDGFTRKQDLIDLVQAKDPNELQEATEKVEATFGTNPQGSAPTVRDRLDRAISADGYTSKPTQITVNSGNATIDQYGFAIFKKFTVNATVSRPLEILNTGSSATNYGYYSTVNGAGTNNMGIYSWVYNGTNNFAIYSDVSGGATNTGIYSGIASTGNNYGIRTDVAGGTANYDIYCNQSTSFVKLPYRTTAPTDTVDNGSITSAFVSGLAYLYVRMNDEWNAFPTDNAARSLGNLNNVAINTSLLPGSDNSIDIGAVSGGNKRFKDAYFSGTGNFANIIDSNLTTSRPVFTDGSKQLTSTGVLAWDQGGTGQSTWTQGDLLYASANNTLAKLPKGAATYFLNMSATIPQWFNLFGTANTFTATQTVPNLIDVGLSASRPVFTDSDKQLTSSGVLGYDQGGTGQNSYAQGDMLYASVTNVISKLAKGTAGWVLQITATVPQWFNLFGTANTFTATQTVSNLIDNGLTVSKPVFTDSGNQLTSSGIVPYDQGGTGLNSYTQGDIVYAPTNNAIGRLTKGTAGYFLNMSATIPQWFNLFGTNNTWSATQTMNISGNVTGNVTGNVSGNAGTVTTNANLSGPIGSSGNTTSITSQTGTGTKFVVDNTPTITTPTISGTLNATGNVALGNDRTSSQIQVGAYGHIIGRNSADGALYIGGGQANVTVNNNLVVNGILSATQIQGTKCAIAWDLASNAYNAVNLGSICVPYAITITAVKISVDTSPNGGGNLIIDVNQTPAGSPIPTPALSIFDTNQGDRPMITANGATFQATSGTPHRPSVSAGDTLSFDIDSVPTTPGGAHLRVTIYGVTA